MDKTINKICMVFQGLGKTYVKTHEDELGIHVEDFDFKKFDHSNPEWFTDYTTFKVILRQFHKLHFL